MEKILSKGWSLFNINSWFPNKTENGIRWSVYFFRGRFYNDNLKGRITVFSKCLYFFWSEFTIYSAFPKKTINRKKFIFFVVVPLYFTIFWSCARMKSMPVSLEKLKRGNASTIFTKNPQKSLSLSWSFLTRLLWFSKETGIL